jgi:DNA-binding MarR family transcriptional regulator
MSSADSESYLFDQDSVPDRSETGSLIDERYDLRILRSLRRIIRAVDVYSSKLKVQYQLTAPQLICLTSIVANAPATATRVAKEVFLSTSTVVGILDRLEDRGLIRRLRDKNDRRIVNVQATSEGVNLVQSAPSALQDKLAMALYQLSESEQATIAKSLRRIANLMDLGYSEAVPFVDEDETDRMPKTSGRRVTDQEGGR